MCLYVHKLFKESLREDYFLALTRKELLESNTNQRLWSSRFIDLESNCAYSVAFSSEELKSISEGSAFKKDLPALAEVAFSPNSTPEHKFGISEGYLLWKKDTGTIKVKLASFKIVPFDGVIELHKQIFEESLKKTREEMESKQFFKDNFAKLSEDRKGLLLRVHQMTEDKTKMETEFYSHFLPILNAKKDRIRELEAQIEKSEGTRESPSQSKTHAISSSESEEDEVKSSKELDTSQNFLNLSLPLL